MRDSVRVRHPLNEKALDEKLAGAIARVGGELPREISPRSGSGLTRIEIALQLPLTSIDNRGRDRDRLEQLERELAELLSTSAPNAWRSMRRTIRRLLRNARAEIRGRRIQELAP